VTDETIVVLEHMACARRAAARLVGADEGEIALVESTQQGLNAAADLLALAPGENVLASDVEFFGTVLPWRGPGLRLVPHRAGRPEVDEFEAAIDGSTRAIVVSSVQEVTGALVDLPALSALCREHGLWLVVDGAQHVGPLPLDVRETPVDVLAVGGHKWLCCPFGLGFLYVRRGILAERDPRRRGYFALEPPPGGWSPYLESPERTPVDDLGFTRAARGLEPGGTGPYMAAAALAACLEALLELPGRFARVQALVGLVTDGLDRLGLEVVSPRDSLSGIVVFGAPDAHNVVDRLAGAGVAVSLRRTAGVRWHPRLPLRLQRRERRGATARRAHLNAGITRSPISRIASAGSGPSGPPMHTCVTPAAARRSIAATASSGVPTIARRSMSSVTAAAAAS